MSIRNVRERHRKKWSGARGFIYMISHAIKKRQDKKTKALKKQPSSIKKNNKADVSGSNTRGIGGLFNYTETELVTTPKSPFGGPNFSSK